MTFTDVMVLHYKEGQDLFSSSGQSDNISSTTSNEGHVIEVLCQDAMAKKSSSSKASKNYPRVLEYINTPSVEKKERG